MSVYGNIPTIPGPIVKTLSATARYIEQRSDAADWYLLPHGVGVGWTYDGATYTGPDGQDPQPEPPAYERYVLLGAEWVERFTDAEWRWLKDKRNEVDGQGDPTTAALQLDRVMDAVRWTNSIDVRPGSPSDPFYQFLVDQGIPGGQSRVDELRIPK